MFVDVLLWVRSVKAVERACVCVCVCVERQRLCVSVTHCCFIEPEQVVFNGNHNITAPSPVCLSLIPPSLAFPLIPLSLSLSLIFSLTHSRALFQNLVSCFPVYTVYIVSCRPRHDLLQSFPTGFASGLRFYIGPNGHQNSTDIVHWTRGKKSLKSVLFYYY